MRQAKAVIHKNTVNTALVAVYGMQANAMADHQLQAQTTSTSGTNKHV